MAYIGWLTCFNSDKIPQWADTNSSLNKHKIGVNSGVDMITTITETKGYYECEPYV